VDRLHERVRSLEGAQNPRAVGEDAAPERPTVAGGLLRAVASHDVDPYAAADAILDRLIHGESTP
jgi:hypothetical protein